MPCFGASPGSVALTPQAISARRFYVWVWDGASDPMVSVDIDYEPHRVPIEWLLGRLSYCTDILPGGVYRELEMTGRQTVAAAVQHVRRQRRTS